jgi:Cd2+/Zn2+-exporting ATPase
VDNFEALAGRGVRGESTARPITWATTAWSKSWACARRNWKRSSSRWRNRANRGAAARQSGPLALFAVADTVKDSSREAIRQLHELGIKTLMLTGDNAHRPGHRGAGRHRPAEGDLLPTDKLQAIEALYAQGHRVGMVGDGINDAPALARAEIGFAMAAAGTDTAIETADVALMDDDLRKIPAFISLSRQTASILKQNIAWPW